MREILANIRKWQFHFWKMSFQTICSKAYRLLSILKRSGDFQRIILTVSKHLSFAKSSISDTVIQHPFVTRSCIVTKSTVNFCRWSATQLISRQANKTLTLITWANIFYSFVTLTRTLHAVGGAPFVRAQLPNCRRTNSTRDGRDIYRRKKKKIHLWTTLAPIYIALWTDGSTRCVTALFEQVRLTSEMQFCTVGLKPKFSTSNFKVNFGIW